MARQAREIKSVRVEDVVRRIGREHGPRGVFRALRALFARALEDQLVAPTPEHRGMLAAVFSERADARMLKQELEDNSSRETDDPRYLGRGNDARKLVYYTFLALTAGPKPAGKPGRTDPIEGYTVQVGEAMCRILNLGAANQDELRQIHTELATMMEQAARNPMDHDVFKPTEKRTEVPRSQRERRTADMDARERAKLLREQAEELERQAASEEQEREEKAREDAARAAAEEASSAEPTAEATPSAEAAEPVQAGEEESGEGEAGVWDPSAETKLDPAVAAPSGKRAGGKRSGR